MADTLTTQSATPATIPASTVIATDDAGAGGHVQIVKLAISTDGSATALTADNTSGMLVNPRPNTTGGLSVGNFTTGDSYTALTNTAQVVKGSAGQVYGWFIYNPNTTAAYVMVYNVAAASVTVG